MSTLFLLTCLLVVLLPGTGAMYVMSAGLRHGSAGGVLASVSCAIGTLPHLLLAVSGLAVLLRACPAVFSVLSLLGAVYLVHLAVGAWRSRSLMVADPDAGPPASTLRVLRDGVAINLLNPKLTAFFLAFLPQFVPARAAHPTLAMVELGAVFVGITVVVFIGYAIGAAALRDHLRRRPGAVAWLHRGFAVCFVALGVELAVAGW